MMERAHCLDGLAIFMGTRLIALDVWVDASPSEAEKLKSFNMMKQPFYQISESQCGIGGVVVGLVSGLTACASWMIGFGFFFTAGLAFLSAASLWMTYRGAQRSRLLKLSVKDVVNKKVPFIRDNPRDIHEIAVEIEGQYQRLFGAMYEIESFGVVREFEWKQQGAIA